MFDMAFVEMHFPSDVLAGSPLCVLIALTIIGPNYNSSKTSLPQENY